ncbi:PbsX family transcriptional regulator [Methylovulum psychrotolerans]|uniref:AbrB/MazE/SpoVT family DNA-binding domain-containing protein n=1 Tax=Methylovulum psychrotolerans TaxID=1704499 RepID=UPI001BFF2CF7|nr:PbsX family transcriptional regulator [Methylovulum psychrotolerans]MBT9098581.1 PbsX family transcriptional regulator [Methylovulum psychrotolerans]
MQAAQLNLEQGIEVCAENGRIIIESASPVFTLATLLDGITDSNRHNELDVGKLQGQEQL